MRINKELTVECPMTVEILNSASHKKTELVIRLAEMQLKFLGYNRDQFRTKEDIRFVIEMMNRGFVAGCPSSGGKLYSGGRQKRRITDKKKGNTVLKRDRADAYKEKAKRESSEEIEGHEGYLEMIRCALGDEEFSSITGSEV